MKVQSLLHQGRREVQEDGAFYFEELGVLGVCDGFGGKGAGDAGVQRVQEAVKGLLESLMKDSDATLPFAFHRGLSDGLNMALNGVLFADQELRQWNRDKTVQARGGASTVLAIRRGNRVSLAQVGLCQAYWRRGGKWEPLFRMKSFSAELAPTSDSFRHSRESGNPPLSLTEALDFPTEYLGGQDEVRPQLAEIQIAPGDEILLCSDGFFPHVSELSTSDFSALSMEQEDNAAALRVVVE